MFSIALVHYPIINKHDEIVTTSVTNIDIHDISRVSRTYGVDNYFVVTPSELQQIMVKKVMDHWLTGFGAEYNQTRTQAIKTITVKESLEETINSCEDDTIVIATSARKIISDKNITFEETRELIKNKKNILIIFGTGWGLAEASIEKCHKLLEPVNINSGYNHLSVRSAVSIILDRLLSRN